MDMALVAERSELRPLVATAVDRIRRRSGTSVPPAASPRARRSAVPPRVGSCATAIVALAANSTVGLEVQMV
jgi:hypothetical protein